MSDELAAYVRYIKLGHPEKEILRCMCNVAGDIPGKLIGTDCYPSNDWLSWSSDYSDRKVRQSLRKLEAMGIVVPIRVHPELGTTEFELHLYRAPKKEPFVSKKKRGPGRDFSKIKKGEFCSPYPAEISPYGGNSVPPTRQEFPPMGGITFPPGEAESSPYPEQNSADFSITLTCKELPPTPLASEGGKPKERKLTRQERKRLEMSLGTFETKTFATAVCEMCPAPHEWSLREAIVATSQPRMACPEFRSHLKGVS